jgi:hypothetical protein
MNSLFFSRGSAAARSRQKGNQFEAEYETAAKIFMTWNLMSRSGGIEAENCFFRILCSKVSSFLHFSDSAAAN